MKHDLAFASNFINQAFNLISSELYTATEANGFSTHSPIYIASTSNVKSLFDLYTDGSYENVLSIGGCGSHGFEALLRGAKKVDLFDINFYQKIYFNLMKESIKHLDYETFIGNFTLTEGKQLSDKSNYANLLSSTTYGKVRYFLENETRSFFDWLYSNFSNTEFVTSNLFRHYYVLDLEFLKFSNSIYIEDEYYKLQNILNANPDCITYHIADILDVPNVFKDKYDLIILDNLLQYHYNIPELKGINDVENFVDDHLLPMIRKNGSIQVCYGYIDTYEYFDICSKFENIETLETLVSVLTHPNKEFFFSQSNLCIQLCRRDTFSTHVIPGIEHPCKNGARNLIVTKSK